MRWSAMDRLMQMNGGMTALIRVVNKEEVVAKQQNGNTKEILKKERSDTVG